MAIHDSAYGGYRIFVGDLGPKVLKQDLEKAFETYGRLLDVWVARNPPGCAFVLFKYPEEAEKAVDDMEGRTICGRRIRIEHARPYDSNAKSRKPINTRDVRSRRDIRPRHDSFGSRDRGRRRSWDARRESRPWPKLQRRSPPSRYIAERHNRKRSSGYEYEEESWGKHKRRSMEYRDRALCDRKWRPEREQEEWERAYEKRERTSRSGSSSRKVPLSQPRSQIGSKVTTKTDRGNQTDDLLTTGDSLSTESSSLLKPEGTNGGTSSDKQCSPELDKNEDIEEHSVMSVSIGTDTNGDETLTLKDCISSKDGEKGVSLTGKEPVLDKGSITKESSSEKSSSSSNKESASKEKETSKQDRGSSHTTDKCRNSSNRKSGRGRSESGHTASGLGGEDKVRCRSTDSRHEPMQVDQQTATKDQGCGPDSLQDTTSTGGRRDRHHLSVVLTTSNIKEESKVRVSGSGSGSTSTSLSNRRRNWSEDSDSDLSDDDNADHISIGMGDIDNHEHGGGSPRTEGDKRVVVPDVPKDKWTETKEKVIHIIADIPVPVE